MIPNLVETVKGYSKYEGTILDDITFISSDIIYDSYFENILGTSASNGILLISNALLFGFVLYYSLSYLRLTLLNYSVQLNVICLYNL